MTRRLTCLAAAGWLAMALHFEPASATPCSEGLARLDQLTKDAGGGVPRKEPSCIKVRIKRPDELQVDYRNLRLESDMLQSSVPDSNGQAAALLLEPCGYVTTSGFPSESDHASSLYGLVCARDERPEIGIETTAMTFATMSLMPDGRELEAICRHREEIKRLKAVRRFSERLSAYVRANKTFPDMLKPEFVALTAEAARATRAFLMSNK